MTIRKYIFISFNSNVFLKTEYWQLQEAVRKKNSPVKDVPAFHATGLATFEK